MPSYSDTAEYIIRIKATGNCFHNPDVFKEADFAPALSLIGCFYESVSSLESLLLL